MDLTLLVLEDINGQGWRRADEKYNLDPKNLSGFISLVKERIEVAGWDMTIDVNGTKIDVLTHYATVSVLKKFSTSSSVVLDTIGNTDTTGNMGMYCRENGRRHTYCTDHNFKRNDQLAFDL